MVPGHPADGYPNSVGFELTVGLHTWTAPHRIRFPICIGGEMQSKEYDLAEHGEGRSYHAAADLAAAVGSEVMSTTSTLEGLVKHSKSLELLAPRSRYTQSNPMDDLGRTLAWVLRHKAVDLKLNLGKDGFVSVDELLKLDVKTSAGHFLSSFSIVDVKMVVERDRKQRFGMKDKEGCYFIRAHQGHTMQNAIDSAELLKIVISPKEISVCVHGTFSRNLQSILKDGLRRMGRKHVHFASGLPTEGVISGMKLFCDILIHLDVEKAMTKGRMKLYISTNGVILTEGLNGLVPREFFLRVETWPGRQLVSPVFL